MKFLYSGQLKGEKLQFVGGVVGFSLCQTPTSISNDGISAIIMNLVEDSPQARPTSVSVQFKSFMKSAKARMGAVVHRYFRSLKDHWHLSSQVMATFFVPAFSSDITLCKG